MELALVASALFGVGIVYSRRSSPQPKSQAEMVTPSTISKVPVASNELGPNPLASNTARQSTNVHTDQLAARVPSGRRDNSLFIDKSSLEERQSRYYTAPLGTKREVENDEPQMRQENVFVRSNTNYLTDYRATLDRPWRMNNVNPISTTSGTASQLVGPGLVAGKDDMVGKEGLHYGMVRMKPNDVYTHFREQKGSIIPGKNNINARTSEMPLEQKKVANLAFGESGYETGDPNQPLRTFGISEAYQTSAPGRASVTGNPGYAGRRLEPTERPTNRGIDSNLLGPAGIDGGITAPRHRDEYARTALARTSTERGRTNEFMGVVQGESAPGYQNVLDAFEIAKNERSSTECAKGEHLLNLANPGQQIALVNRQPTQTTQRQGMHAHDTANLAPQFPNPGAHPDQQVRHTQRVQNEYRPGPAQLAAVPNASGQDHQSNSLDTSRLSQLTQRESTQHNDFQAPLKSVGVNAPMSYTDVLQSEGYSNRDVPQIGYVTGAGNMNIHTGKEGGMQNFDEKPPELNYTRNSGGGIGNQFQSNFYVRQEVIDSNPNREATLNTRIDPRVLDALTKNELALAQKS